MIIRSPLVSVELRDFQPMTHKSHKSVDRKEELRHALEKKLGQQQDLANSIKRCKSKNLSLDVTFYLWRDDSSSNDMRTPDLDNLLKILLDTLQVYRDNPQENKGLGLISDDSVISKICCKKEPVESKAAAGIDLKIYKC